MRLDTSQHMKMDMRLRMAPRMIQSMEILQLPLMALQERIDQELSENPVLELREAGPIESDGDDGSGGSAEVDGTPEAAEFDGMDDWNDSHRPSRAALSEEADRKHDAMQNMASRPRTLHDDLEEQLGFLDCDPTIRSLCEYIIHNLDENGYLNLTLNEVVRDFGGEATLSQGE